MAICEARSPLIAQVGGVAVVYGQSGCGRVAGEGAVHAGAQHQRVEFVYGRIGEQIVAQLGRAVALLEEEAKGMFGHEFPATGSALYA